MKRRFSGIVACVMTVVMAHTAMAQPNYELPLNPNVKSGTLANGMQYYIMHNSEPKGRANFYIAQKVGSTLETADQLGLAHFLEHMAFNGTQHFPGKNLLNYLQSKGIRFGEDINAYTKPDETVYNINNVSTSDKELIDSVLLALHDWSCAIALEDKEIEAERGVIENEWRSRCGNAQYRMYETILPQLYKEYQYCQLPIGKMEVVKNFKPSALRAYYKRWYRPDQQGIVIVGDFDANEMEAKVKELFSTIPMPANAEPRTYPQVSDNAETIYVYYDDPELQVARMDFAFKVEKMPLETRNTVNGFVMETLLPRMISTMLNIRLNEAAQKLDCKFAAASVGIEDYWISKTMGALNVRVIAKSDIKAAVNEVMAIVMRALKTGFTPTEYGRVSTDIMSMLERAYNEREKTENSTYAEELIRYFVDNQPAMGIESEFQMMSQLLPNIPVEVVNAFCTELAKEMTKDASNKVVVVSQPRHENTVAVAKEEMLPIIENALNAQYEAYVDEVIKGPIVANLPQAGKIVNQKAGEYGSTVYTLSNGVRVIVKPTDFKADEIVMQAYRKGGLRMFSEKDAMVARLIPLAASVSKHGTFDKVKLSKYLAGKNISLDMRIGGANDLLEGQSTVKDLPTFMEMLYSTFVDLNPDAESFNTVIERNKVSLQNAAKNPDYIFASHELKARYGDNPLQNNITMEMLEQADYDRTLAELKKMLSNAAEYTFIFVGNIDEKTFIPLMEQYIATLPAQGVKKGVKYPEAVKIVKGKVTDKFTQKMSTPVVKVRSTISGDNYPFTQTNDIKFKMFGDILEIIYTETLREEEGGTYGAGVAASLSPVTNQWSIIYLYDTSLDQVDGLNERATKELNQLVKKGAKEVHFNKVKEAMIKQLENTERTNGYWVDGIFNKERGLETVNGRMETIKGITLKEFNKFMKGLDLTKNVVFVEMRGEAEAK